jgi:hypothetical protein
MVKNFLERKNPRYMQNKKDSRISLIEIGNI